MQRDVSDSHLRFVFTGTLHTVVHHDVAERASRRHARRTGGDRLAGALVVHFGADILFHPHARATRTAAHAGRAVARHLDDLHSFD